MKNFVLFLSFGIVLLSTCWSLEFPDTPEGKERKRLFIKEIDKFWKESEVKDANPPIIDAKTFGIGDSQIKGEVMRISKKKTINAFKGIRYAEAERFQIPKPCDNNGQYWEGMYNATLIKYTCVQSSDEPFYESEDCLFLNVYTPYLPDELGREKLAVMVFIYGGSFTSGSSYYYLPNKLLKHDIILVTINYRLGAFGFFTLNTDEAPGNYALYDQREALRWVQKHISDFGGDPDRVTVFGESAGSVSSSYMTIVADKGTIHRAISESGTTMEVWSIDEDPAYAANYIAEDLGCMDNTAINMTCMRGVTAGELDSAMGHLKHSDRRSGLMGFRGCSPTIQPSDLTNPIFTKRATEYYEDGDALDIPYMIGVNKQEGSYVLYVMLDDYMEPNDLLGNSSYMREEMVTDILGSFGVEDPSHGIANTMIMEYCPGIDLADFDAAAPCLIDMVGVLFLRAGGWKVANYHSKYTNSPTYFYSLDYSEGPSMSVWLISFRPPFDPGVGHADDLSYIFPMPVLMNGEYDKIVEARMTLMWTNFAKYGDPTPPDQFDSWNELSIPRWQSYNFQDHYYLLMRKEFIIQNEFPLRWTITMDEINANDTQLSMEPPYVTEEPQFADFRDKIILYAEAAGREGRYTQKDIDDIEDERQAYMIAMIVFIVTFCIMDCVAFFFFMKWRKKSSS